MFCFILFLITKLLHWLGEGLFFNDCKGDARVLALFSILNALIRPCYPNLRLDRGHVSYWKQRAWRTIFWHLSWRLSNIMNRLGNNSPPHKHSDPSPFSVFSSRWVRLSDKETKHSCRFIFVSALFFFLFKKKQYRQAQQSSFVVVGSGIPGTLWRKGPCGLVFIRVIVK